MTTLIGALNESSLHESLKQLYAEPGDALEAPVGSFIADILRGEQIIEIQTGSFFPLKRKLNSLLDHYNITIVHPIACERWITKLPSESGDRESLRKSPKKRQIAHVFEKLVSIPQLLAHPNLDIEIVAIQEDEIRVFDKQRRRRRGEWRVKDRCLRQILGRRVIRTPMDLFKLIPSNLPIAFTSTDIASALSCSRELGQQAAYCLRKSGAATVVGKNGNLLIYSQSTDGTL